MKSALTSIAAIVLVVLVGVPSQAAGYDATIMSPVAEVRGGPSSVFPVTGALRQRARVHVLREESGWLAIAPPDGSSSWIMERVLDRQPVVGKNMICAVHGENVPVALGSADRISPHPNEANKVSQGTSVVVLGEKSLSDAWGEKTVWWRIQPTSTEVRWISKESISATATNVASSSPVRSTPLNDLFARAEQAERSGNIPQAITWYRQVSSEQARSGGDQDLAVRAYNRAESLSRRPAPTMSIRSSASVPSDTPGAWPTGVIMTSGPGTLRRAAFQIDGQNAYVLEDSRGNVRVYVVAQQGINLEPFINRQVEMFGPMTNRPELTVRGYMSVGKLHLLR